MSYTITNLKDVEDAAARHGFGHIQEARFAGRVLDAQNTGLAHFFIRPGQQQGFAHRHENAEEVYVILRGSGRVKLGDDVSDVAPLDAIRVAPQVARSFEAGPEGLEYLAFGPRHDGDGEILKGDFWQS